MHQGAENSALKNKAPLSLTTFNTSESASIADRPRYEPLLSQGYGTLDQVFKAPPAA
jgi:hypothetical protein